MNSLHQMLGMMLMMQLISGCSANESSPCDGVDCSGHGTCFDNGESFLCDCEEGYLPQGPNCLLEGSDADIGGDSDETPDALDSDGDVDNSDDSDIDEVPDGDASTCSSAIEFSHSYSSSSYPKEIRGMAFSDFDGDGFPEAVMSGNLFGPSNIPGFAVYKNGTHEKTRRFLDPFDYTFEAYETVGAVAVGNLDVDDEDEIIHFLSSTHEKEGPGLFHITDNPRHDSDWSTERYTAIPHPLTYGDVADLDGDTFIDIVALSADDSTTNGHLLAWQRTSDDISSATADVTELTGQPGKLISFDANPGRHDGHEIVVSFPENSRLDLFTYDVDTTEFNKVGDVLFESAPLDMASAYLDVDDLVDIIVVTALDGLQLVEVGKGPTLGSPALFDDTYEYLAVTIADIDLDGDPDILAVDEDRLVVFCNHYGEFNIIDQILHNDPNVDEPLISTVLLDDGHYPDVIVGDAVMLVFYNSVETEDL